VGLDEYRMGDLDDGIDLTLQKTILDLTVDNRPVCRDCWARYLCGGGCWKHAVDRNGGLEIPDNDYSCEIIRHEIECAMAVNSELKVGDEAILSDLYEKSTEPYLIPPSPPPLARGGRGVGETLFERKPEISSEI
jgi:radical SAM protein with 4Fe4S-binding SPASM domain